MIYIISLQKSGKPKKKYFKGIPGQSGTYTKILNDYYWFPDNTITVVSGNTFPNLVTDVLYIKI